ncbi:unnamed protein product [Trifolium pratense]|uniref:Uncharacterized protein n=1 Tax=Trifolium pratense TaxID=57577 RepID=A0ACB0L0W0_TRIPR|nr:unnamed protein product [Trifolium pratense]
MAENLKFVFLVIIFVSSFLVVVKGIDTTKILPISGLGKECVTDKDCCKRLQKQYGARRYCLNGYCVYRYMGLKNKMGEEDNNGWHTVRGRQRHQRDNNRNHNFDIATARGFNKENIKLLTTYFFTDFPDNVRAKTCFNAFLSYGDIAEVVIPAKRDKGGRRFEFARFDRVADPRKLEIDMDNILIGRVKISVNLSRFHRPEGNNSGEDRNAERKEKHVNNHYVHNRPRYSSTNGRQQSHHSRENMKDSYAYAVRSGDASRLGDRQQTIVLSYNKYISTSTPTIETY